MVEATEAKEDIVELMASAAPKPTSVMEATVCTAFVTTKAFWHTFATELSSLQPKVSKTIWEEQRKETDVS